MPYNFEVKEFTARPTVAVRVHAAMADLPRLMGRWFGAIGKYLMEAREPPAGMPYAGYMSVDGDQAEVEIGFPVARSLPGLGEIQPHTLPGGKMATCVHFGPYEQLESAYNALVAWAAEQKLDTTGVWYEFYMNDPNQVAPEQVQTMVLLQLK